MVVDVSATQWTLSGDPSGAARKRKGEENETQISQDSVDKWYQSSTIKEEGGRNKKMDLHSKGGGEEEE